MTYSINRLSRIDGSSIRALTSIPGALTEQGITYPAGVDKALQRHQATNQHIDDVQAQVNVDQAHMTAARALADGKGDAAQLTAAAATQIINSKDPSSPLRQIINRARDLAANDLQTAHAEHGDTWITKHLRPALERAIEALTAETQWLAPFNPFMEPNAADHLTRNPRVDEAWRTIRTVYETARTLRRYRIIPATGDRRADLYEWSGDAQHHEQRGGDTLVASIRDNMTDNNLTWFITAMQGGMAPVLLTEHEVTG